MNPCFQATASNHTMRCLPLPPRLGRWKRQLDFYCSPPRASCTRAFDISTIGTDSESTTAAATRSVGIWLESEQTVTYWAGTLQPGGATWDCLLHNGVSLLANTKEGPQAQTWGRGGRSRFRPANREVQMEGMDAVSFPVGSWVETPPGH